ncbi:Hsp70-Hsp90 organizing protein 1, partial [Bienertia sinuspersici]
MLTPSQLQNYALYEIEEIPYRNNRSIKDFEGMPYPDISLLYDTESLKTEATQLEDRDIEYLTERAILGPTNKCVEDINNYKLSMLPAEEIIHRSVDRVSPLAN